MGSEGGMKGGRVGRLVVPPLLRCLFLYSGTSLIRNLPTLRFYSRLTLRAP